MFLINVEGTLEKLEMGRDETGGHSEHPLVRFDLKCGNDGEEEGARETMSWRVRAYALITRVME